MRRVGQFDLGLESLEGRKQRVPSLEWFAAKTACRQRFQLDRQAVIAVVDRRTAAAVGEAVHTVVAEGAVHTVAAEEVVRTVAAGEGIR